MDIPAPGGSVGAKTFAVYTLGATAGVVLYVTTLTNYIPDAWEQKQVGPVTGAHVFIAMSALLGAAAAAMVLKK